MVWVEAEEDGSGNMIVAITSNQNNLNSSLSNSFGRCDFIIFYDTVKMNYSAISNPFKSAMDSAGIHTANLIISKNVDAVITNQIGENALRFLYYAGIKIFICQDGSIEQNINKLLNKEINEINIPIRQCQFQKRRGRGKQFNY